MKPVRCHTASAAKRGENSERGEVGEGGEDAAAAAETVLCPRHLCRGIYARAFIPGVFIPGYLYRGAVAFVPAYRDRAVILKIKNGRLSPPVFILYIR